MKTTRRNNRVSPLRWTASTALACGLLFLASCQGGGSEAPEQLYFPTADAAANALLLACQQNDLEALAAILGSEHPEVYMTSDPASDLEGRKSFCKLSAQKQYFQEAGLDTLELVVGDEEWPLPIPLVKTEKGWYFDTAAGAEEMIARRIGRNEIEAIELCRGIIYAQQEYAETDWDGDGVYEYATKIEASPGKTDGLYWPAGGEAGPSPLEGFFLDNRDYAEMWEDGTAWRGYRIKLLTSQGPDAPGGAESYYDGDKLLEGFAILLCPADHGSLGIMSFMASHHGTVYEKDLGPDSIEIGKAMTEFNPDPSWTPVQ